MDFWGPCSGRLNDFGVSGGFWESEDVSQEAGKGPPDLGSMMGRGIIAWKG